MIKLIEKKYQTNGKIFSTWEEASLYEESFLPINEQVSNKSAHLVSNLLAYSKDEKSAKIIAKRIDEYMKIIFKDLNIDIEIYENKYSIYNVQL